MECVTSDLGLSSTPSSLPHSVAIGAEKRIARASSRSSALNRSGRADEFAAFADQILGELHPAGLLERLMADQVAHSAWRLKASLERNAARNLSIPPESEVDETSKRQRPTALELASRSVREAFESFELIRGRRQPATVSSSRFPTAIEPNEWPIVPTDGFDKTPTETANWRDRLIFDFEVSDRSPVVKGTWITVSHVVSLIVDGWSWADILRSHPELTEDDIRTCVSYAMDEENAT